MAHKTADLAQALGVSEVSGGDGPSVA